MDRRIVERHPVAAAQYRLAVPEDVIGEPDARRPVVLLRLAHFLTERRTMLLDRRRSRWLPEREVQGATHWSVLGPDKVRAAQDDAIQWVRNRIRLVRVQPIHVGAVGQRVEVLTPVEVYEYDGVVCPAMVHRLPVLEIVSALNGW